jgi:hypothetical protein
LIALQDIVSEAAQSGENARILSDSRCIFTERDISRVMRGVFYSPVLADRGCGGFGCDGAAGQIERDFAAVLPESCGGQETEDRALDPDDCRHMRLPFRSGDRRLGFEHGDGSGFVAIAPVLVDAFLAR